MFLKQPRQTPPSNPSNLVWISLVLGAILSEFERFRAILEGLLGRPRFWRALVVRRFRGGEGLTLFHRSQDLLPAGCRALNTNGTALRLNGFRGLGLYQTL